MTSRTNPSARHDSGRRESGRRRDEATLRYRYSLASVSLADHQRKPLANGKQRVAEPDPVHGLAVEFSAGAAWAPSIGGRPDNWEVDSGRFGWGLGVLLGGRSSLMVRTDGQFPGFPLMAPSITRRRPQANTPAVR